MPKTLHLDLGNACLRQGESEILLTPKALSVVGYLIAHAGKVSTKEALLNTVWADEEVSEYALTSIIRDLRRALGDSTKNPRYIETVHRQGYRWIGQVAPIDSDQTAAGPITVDPSAPEGLVEVTVSTTMALETTETQSAIFTGRATELEQLHLSLKLASQGKRQLMFLTGEAGIGKTSLLEKFTTQIIGRPNCSVVLGQCIEKYGAGEAYRPILEALNRFCLTAEGQPYIQVLEQYAPSWLMQMPPLLTPEQLLNLQKKEIAPKERWLRELAEALDVITQDRLLVIILEDLHWVDPSTVELLDLLTRRQESAQLMVLASYRPAEVNASNHPLKHTKQELQLHALCQEIALDYLDQQAIADYLSQRFPHQFLSPTVVQPEPSSDETQLTIANIASEIHRRTEGSPLFMVNVVDSLIEKRTSLESQDSINLQNLSLTAVPRNLQQLIDCQFDLLDLDQQKILETASVEGAEFLSVTVAKNLNMDSEQVELCIDELVQLNHLIAIDDVEILPNGTLSTRYRFIHALYQEGLYQRLARNRRVRLHRSLGAQLETIYGNESHKIAAQLALHFEQGMDYAKAIHYQQHAGENALRRNAHPAAVKHFQHGLDLLPQIKVMTERNLLELKLQPLLGTALMTCKGQSAPEVGQAFERAQMLCHNIRLSDATPSEQFDVTLGFWRHTFIGGNLPKSLELGQQCFAFAEQTQDPAHLGNAHYALAGTLMYQGHLTQALDHAETGLTHYRRLTLNQALALSHSQDPRATLMAYRAWILFFLGSLDQARQAMDEMLALDIVRSHPQTFVSSLTYSGILYLYLRAFDPAQKQLKEAIQLAQEWGIPQFATIAQFFLTCTLCLSEKNSDKLLEMEQVLAIRRTSGAELHATGYLNHISAGYLTLDQPEASLPILSQVPPMIKQNSEHLFEAETYRLMGELLLLPGATQNEEKAETFLQQSLAVAQQQNAKIFELRSATCLAQLWKRRGKTFVARDLLAPVYNRFTEGFHFRDLQRAKHLLEV